MHTKIVQPMLAVVMAVTMFTSPVFAEDIKMTGVQDDLRERIVAEARRRLEEIRRRFFGCQAIVCDDFNSYTNGSVVGQGGWESDKDGHNFIVQDVVTNEGAKAIHASALADSVIVKAGNTRTDGRQTFSVRTENRSNWGFYVDGNAQFRVSKSTWGGSRFAAVSLRSDGHVAYYDPIAGAYLNFDTYNDNEWTLIEIEWRSSDAKVRFRVNSGTWTDWKPISGSGAFTDFDHVGFDFFLPSGAGGAYFDTLR